MAQITLPRDPWKVRQDQNIYDLAIQIYGDIESLAKVIFQLDNLADPPTGSLIETEFTDNFLANNLFNKKLVATSQSELMLTVDSDTITADETDITADQTITV